MKNFVVILAIAFLAMADMASAKEKLIADFFVTEFGFRIEAQSYTAQDYWEGKGAKEIVVSDNSGAKSKDIMKTINVKDVRGIDSSIYSFMIMTRNESITSVSFKTDQELGNFILDSFKEYDAEYNPGPEPKGNLNFSGTFTFDDYIVNVSNYKPSGDYQFTVSMSGRNRKLQPLPGLPVVR